MKTANISTGSGCLGLVDVGGRGLYIECRGNGQPTVVLEAGATATGDMWLPVRDSIATFTHVCTYDRANLGRSNPAPKPRTTSDMAVDLAALLANANVAGPYVLVGASFGGLIVRLYAARHLQDVAGMVLVDSTHPDQIAHITSILPPPREETTAMRQLREWVTTTDPTTHPEGITFETSLRQVKETSVARGLGSIPLAVLSRGVSVQRDFPALPSDLATELDAAWLDAQRDLAHLSTNGVHQIATKSGHNISGDEPELVVETVRRIVNTVRAQL